MLTETIDVQEGQINLSELISRVMAGTEIILTEGKTPLVRMVPIAQPLHAPRVAGLHNGAITVSDDFDAPLSDDFWTGSP
jgi:antitoxin (DNA-binding transcriptional repressor) of toxin-antitoxin stability system